MKIFKTIPIPLAANCHRFLLSVAWLFLGAFCTNAQSLVTEISSATANLSTQEAQTYQNLQQDAYTKTLKLVSFGNPTDFMNDNGVMTFTLPGLDGTIVAKVIDITQTANSFGWIGKLTNQNGNLAIYEIDGLRAAWIQTGQRFFELMPIKNGVSTLREIKGDIGDVIDCIAPEGNPVLPVDFCADAYNTCSAQIDILVLVPQDVRDYLYARFGNNPLIVSLYVGIGTYYSITAAFINSDIPNKSVNIKLEAFNYNYPSPLDCQIGLLEGGPMYVGLNTQAAARRAAVGADLVVLLTAMDFPCGGGVAIDNPSDGGQPAFAIVEIPWLVGPRWTFAHEVGHLLSARHSRSVPGPGNDDAPDCGHGWTVGGNRFQRTVMAPWFGTETPPDTRILYYSNPSVPYNGSPTGTATSDNAKSIRNAACSVSSYQAGTTFNASIIAPPWVCWNDSYVNTSAIVQQPTFGNPGVGPYTYEWRWNISGDFINDPSTVYGTTASAQLAIPNIPNGNDFWVRLKVTSSDNIVIYKYRDITILGPDDHHCKNLQGGGGGSNFLLAPSSVYPNPTATEINLEVHSETERTADIVVRNSIGISVYSLKRQSLAKGEAHFQIDVSSLPVGIYTVSILSGSKSGNESLKFIIAR